MPRVSPTLEGFRAAFRRPSLTFAEIAWRWTIGALAWSVLFFWVIEYLNTLPVSDVDATLLSTRQPVLVGRALAHIFRGSLNRATLAALLAAIALSSLWIILASIGRAATVRALLDYFRKDIAAGVSPQTSEASGSRVLRSLIGLNFLRAALALAATLAVLGAAILMSLVSSRANPHPGLAFILFLLLAGVICIVWPTLNWLLSLATIFAVRDGDDALSSLSAAVSVSQERAGPVAAVSTWTGLAHLTAFVGASTLASFPLAFLQIAPIRLVIAAIILVALGYFAVADWLYMARLAGYVFIAEMPDALVSSAPSPVPPAAGQQFAPPVPAQTTIDRNEPILSDLPNLAVQT